MFPAALVDLGLDRPHLLVGDDKEISAAAGRVEDPGFRHAVSQVQKLARVALGSLKLLPPVVEEQRVQDLQDVRHACVVHPKPAALSLIRDRLNNRTDYVRVRSAEPTS